MYTYVFRSDPCTTLMQPTNPAAGTAAMADALAKFKFDAAAAAMHAAQEADKIKQDAEHAVSAANAAAARVGAELIISQKHAEQLRAELQETKDSLAAAALQMKADATAGMRYPSLVTCHRL